MHWTDLFCGGIIEIEIQKQKKKARCTEEVSQLLLKL